jgi:hypothetical protein
MVRLTNYMTINQTRLTPRAKDKKALISSFDALPEEEIIASETLTKLLQNRRMKANKSRDFSSEPASVAGVMSLHTTAWDWLSPTLKNAARDIDPCMRAITVERSYVRTYRPRMLEDKYIGALRRLLEETLTLGVKEVTTIDSHGLLSNKRAWLWWDGLVLSPTQEEPAVLLDGIKDDIIKEQRQQQESLAMETADREAIQKLVTYVSNMSCAISSSPTTMLSADVVGPLQDLVLVSSYPPLLTQAPPSRHVQARTLVFDGVVRRGSSVVCSAVDTCASADLYVISLIYHSLYTCSLSLTRPSFTGPRGQCCEEPYSQA